MQEAEVEVGAQQVLHVAQMLFQYVLAVLAAERFNSTDIQQHALVLVRHGVQFLNGEINDYKVCID
jgi:hypothetical protein